MVHPKFLFHPVSLCCASLVHRDPLTFWYNRRSFLARGTNAEAFEEDQELQLADGSAWETGHFLCKFQVQRRGEMIGHDIEI